MLKRWIQVDESVEILRIHGYLKSGLSTMSKRKLYSGAKPQVMRTGRTCSMLSYERIRMCGFPTRKAAELGVSRHADIEETTGA